MHFLSHTLFMPHSKYGAGSMQSPLGKCQSTPNHPALQNTGMTLLHAQELPSPSWESPMHADLTHYCPARKWGPSSQFLLQVRQLALYCVSFVQKGNLYSLLPICCAVDSHSLLLTTHPVTPPSPLKIKRNFPGKISNTNYEREIQKVEEASE